MRAAGSRIGQSFSIANPSIPLPSGVRGKLARPSGARDLPSAGRVCRIHAAMPSPGRNRFVAGGNRHPDAARLLYGEGWDGRQERGRSWASGNMSFAALSPALRTKCPRNRSWRSIPAGRRRTLARMDLVARAAPPLAVHSGDASAICFAFPTGLPQSAGRFPASDPEVGGQRRDARTDNADRLAQLLAADARAGSELLARLTVSRMKMRPLGPGRLSFGYGRPYRALLEHAPGVELRVQGERCGGRFVP